MQRLSKRIKILIMSAPLALGAALTLYLNLSDASYITLWPCLIFEFTGIACPGCGGTRAVCSILTLRFFDAVQYNLAVFILFFYLAAVYAYCFYKVIRFNRFIKLKTPHIWFCGILLLAFAVFRNLPFYPWPIGSPFA